MPDRDIIFSAESVVESVSPEYKDGAPGETGANCCETKISMPTEKFKFGYYYESEEGIDEKLKDKKFVKVKTPYGADRWIYEITRWIDPSDCKAGDNWYDQCYFYVDGLVTYSYMYKWSNGHGQYRDETNLCILTQDENGNYSGSMLSPYPNHGDTPIEP